MEMKMGGKNSKIVLSPTFNLPTLKTPCLFKGKVRGDPLSKVFVSGCHNSSEILVSIASSELPGGVLDLSLVDGVTSIVTDDSKPEDYMMNQDYSSEGNYPDYIYPPTSRYQSTSHYSGKLPSSVVLTTNIVYDYSLLKYFNLDHKKTQAWVDKVVGLTKIRMYHWSLGLRIKLRIGTVKYKYDHIRADLKILEYLYKKRLPTLTSYFCQDFKHANKGWASIGSACRRDGYAVNIVELYSRSNSEFLSAQTFAHELGHNVGML